MSLQLEPPQSSLVTIAKRPDATSIKVIAPAAKAWDAMRVAALADGVILLPISGFRSVSRQVELVRAKLDEGQTIESFLQIIAAPGFSEHHTGKAIDIGTPGNTTLDDTFADTPAYAWLRANAVRLNFSLTYPRDNPARFVFEPWHWCWSS